MSSSPEFVDAAAIGKQTPDYADECLRSDVPTPPASEVVVVAGDGDGAADGAAAPVALRRDSCERQWDTIKRKFMSWKATGQRK